MKKMMKKLQLSKETLRNLDSANLSAAIGGRSEVCTVTCTAMCSAAPGCQGTNNCTTHTTNEN